MPKKDISYGIVFTFGLSTLIMLLMFLFLYPSTPYGELTTLDILFVSSIAFFIGLGVSIALIVFLKVSSDFNLSTFTIWLFSLLTWWWIGDVAIGGILVGIVLTILAITLVFTFVLGIVAVLIRNSIR